MWSEKPSEVIDLGKGVGQITVRTWDDPHGPQDVKKEMFELPGNLGGVVVTYSSQEDGHDRKATILADRADVAKCFNTVIQKESDGYSATIPHITGATDKTLSSHIRQAFSRNLHKLPLFVTQKEDAASQVLGLSIDVTANGTPDNRQWTISGPNAAPPRHWCSFMTISTASINTATRGSCGMGSRSSWRIRRSATHRIPPMPPA
jgi:hypothetical protein